MVIIRQAVFWEARLLLIRNPLRVSDRIRFPLREFNQVNRRCPRVVDGLIHAIKGVASIFIFKINLPVYGSIQVRFCDPTWVGMRIAIAIRNLLSRRLRIRSRNRQSLVAEDQLPHLLDDHGDFPVLRIDRFPRGIRIKGGLV